MNRISEINWWIDRTGSTHTLAKSAQAPKDAVVTGKVYPESKSGIIVSLNNKPANLSLISHELLDVLHRRFPGTRWWIKDTNAISAPRHQTAS